MRLPWRSSKSFVHIHLYDDPSSKKLDLISIKRYLEEKFRTAKVDLRKEFISYHLGDRVSELARHLAEIRVKNLLSQELNPEPLYGEVDFELRWLKMPERRILGTMYDGFRLQSLLGELLKEEESDLDHVHIIFTNRLFGSWDEGDRRYHARVIVCGQPSLISTTGIVEAPAMPREFYHLQQRLGSIGTSPTIYEELKDRFKRRFIDYDDERLTEVMKGYALQAVFYQVFLEAFCNEKTCRLYDAHWQEEVLTAQLYGQELCEHHSAVLERSRF